VRDLVPGPDRVLSALTLGQRLALARQRQGWTQKELSERVGKSRATVIQYEQGRLQPPVQQIETMAKVLDVPPEMIAFGRQGLTGLDSDSAGVTSLLEVEIDDKGETVRGGHGLASSLIEHLGVDREHARIYVLASAAPSFGMAKGDRIIVNATTELTQEHRLYALGTRSGVAVARLHARLSTSSSRVNLNSGYGETASYDPGELTVLGLVVGSIQAR
jgi:transcriptional regulator with XRE-family HTH domain